MRRTSKIGACALAAGLVLGHVAPAGAATSTATMAVTATVLSFCTIAALPLAFGNYSTAAVNAATTLTVACTVGTPYNIGLDVGQGAGATIAQRKMTFSSSELSYGLYSDAARTVVWGNTVGTNTLSGTGNGLAQVLSVYGQITANQMVAPGLYTDVVTATITY